MTLIYKNTLNSFPGAIILTNAALYIFIIVNLSIVYFLVRRNETVTEEQEEDTVNILDNEAE